MNLRLLFYSYDQVRSYCNAEFQAVNCFIRAVRCEVEIVVKRDNASQPVLLGSGQLNIK